MTTRLLLLRHATPLPEDQDPARPLSEEGIAEADLTANAVAAFLGLDSKFGRASTNAPPDVVIVHSGKARAEQTAARLRDVLVLGGATLIGDSADGEALAPNADPALAIALMDTLHVQQNTLLVLTGHLPMLHKLAAALGIADCSADSFAPAGGLLLQSVSAQAGWSLANVVDKTSWWMEAPPPPP